MRLLPLLMTLACTADKGPLETGAGDSGDSALDSHTGGDSAPDSHSGGDSGPDEISSESLKEALSAKLRQDMRQNLASGASVAIWMDDQIYAFGYGDKHPETGGEVTPDTLFQIGSDTKKITAIAVLQQVQEGAVSLDDTLSVALPELHFAVDPTIGDEVTVHMLLSHSGALYDYTPWDDAPEDEELSRRATGEFAENEWIMGGAGAYWNYANPGFSLAGLVAEEASGELYADLLQDRIFSPLDMTRTFGRLSEASLESDYATGYGIVLNSGMNGWDLWSDELDYSITTLEMEDQVDNGFTRPAGLVWSTATDQVKLARFLVDGDESVLDTALLRELETAQVPLYPTLEGQSYGYGLFVVDGFNVGSSFYDSPLWVHGGNTLTQTSTFYVLPEQRFAFSILSNGYGDSFNNTVGALLEMVDMGEPADGPSYPEPADLESYAGTYVDHLLGEIVITYDGSSLNISIPALDALGYTVEPELDPVIQDLFYMKVEGASYDITFIDGLDGTPHKYLRNRQFVGVLDGDVSATRPGLPTRGEVDHLLLRARAEDPLRLLRPLTPGPVGERARSED